MPARLSSMELSPPSNPEIDPSDQPSRRKSGRVSKKPDVLTPSFNAKRKRTPEATEDVNGGINTDELSDEADDAEEDEPDEEEQREAKRVKRSRAKMNKPRAAPKKLQANGVTSDLAIRTIGSKSKKAKKPQTAQRAQAEGIGGLYGSIFSGDDTLDVVAADWIKRFREHESRAVSEIVNLVLRSSGCDIEVNEHDIEDPDNAPNRLEDIQEEFQSRYLVDYPIIAKNKGAASFKRSLTEFFNLVIQSIAASGLLLKQPDLIENVQVWITTLSSATNRPFRHTSTLIALEIVSALAALGRHLTDNRAKATRQSEGEKRNKRVNQARVSDLQKRAGEAAEQSQQVDSIISDWFDTVFIHRYRDVDPRIRVDCVAYLSDWVSIYPDQFLDGSHLRYLGWLLSDVSGSTRLEVLKQMQKIFRDDSKIGSLHQFTERFRPRMLEIATRDAELNCRIASIELLDIMRDKGLLEPTDIDTLGKLMFDEEPKIRKALVPFFVANVEDSYEAKVEDLGEEVLEELSPNEDDFESPRLEWLYFKSLVELMQSYDSDDDINITDIDKSVLKDVISGFDSRCSLASQAIFEKLPIMKSWEILAGYLLTDHTVQSDGIAEDLDTQLRQLCKLGELEEAILLDVLNASVKLCLSEVIEEGGQKKAKKTKAQLQELHEKQEAAAQRLAATIPRLLNKFGASPEAASAVLRLERVLNLEIFQELRQDSTTYSSLLEDINKQFLTHENQFVISEARAALLHAKSFEELGEVTEGKLQSLWDDTTLTLARLSLGEELPIRGNLHISVVRALSSTILRISSLASISDGTETLDKAHTLKPSKAARRRQTEMAPVEPVLCLLDIVGRGVPTEDSDQVLSEAEDTLVSQANKSLFFYFMWHARSLKASSRPNSKTISTVLSHLNDFAYRLRQIMSSRHGCDALRVSTAGTLLDLHTVVSTLRPSKDVSTRDIERHPLFEIFSAAPIGDQAQKILFKILAATEREYARRAGKTLETYGLGVDDDPESSVDENAEPEDDEAEPEASDDELLAGENGFEEDQEAREERAQRREDAKKQKKHRETMVAEQALCGLASRLVVAGFANVVDVSAVKQRLMRNKIKLGQNFKEVVIALERGSTVPSTAGGVKKLVKGKKGPEAQISGTAAKGKRSNKRKEVVSDDAESEEPDVEEGGEEDLRRKELLVEEKSDEEGQADGHGEEAAESNDREGSILGD